MPKTTTAPVALDTARQELAAAEAAAAQLRADVEARAAEALAARDQRLAEFDATAMEKLTERIEAARADEAAAQAELRDRVLDDPVYDAYVRLVAARNTRGHLDQELVTAANRLGQEHRIIEGYSTVPLAEMITGIVDQEAKARAANVIDAHHADREAAGAGSEGTRDDRDPDVEETVMTTPDGRQVKVSRNLRTGTQSVIDTATGLPYTPPTRRASPDDGITDHTRMTDHRRSEWPTRGDAMTID